jgi:septation ring formation regulator EzrA
MRGQITDWRELYRQEKKDHNDTRTSAAAVNSQNSESLRQLSATLDKVSEMLKQFPRRREDWETSGERR